MEPIQSDVAPLPNTDLNGQDQGGQEDNGDTPKDDTNPSISTNIPQDSSSDSSDNPPPAPHISTNTSGIKHALLSHYIALAESHFPSLPSRTTLVFSHIPEITPSTLYSDRENRILFYPGCFNPPYAGHATLLW
jgi:hypothetical protein